MSEPIFQKVRVKKNNIYDTFCSLMIAAGWVDISTDINTDGNVFYSTGETAGKGIYLNFSSGLAVTGRADIQSSLTQPNIYIRPCFEYTPASSPRTPGTFNTTYSWKAFCPWGTHSDVTINVDQEVDMYYSINLNRVILFFDAGPVFWYSSAGEGGQERRKHFVFCGFPDDFDRSNLHGNEECVCFSNSWGCYTASAAGQNGKKGEIARTLYFPKLPINSQDKDKNIFINSAYYGDDYIGVLGQIEGYHFLGGLGNGMDSYTLLLNPGVANRDTILVDDKKYKCFFSYSDVRIGGNYPEYFASNAIAVLRIE